MRWHRTAALSLVLVGALAAPVAAVNVGSIGEVEPDSVHADAIDWLVEHNISAGCAPELFCPNDAVSRAQQATFLQRLANAGVVDAATVEGMSASQLEGQTGPAGQRGLTGRQGPNGTQGDIGLTGAQGMQGDIGLTGAQGIQGDIGLTGAQGMQGDIGLTGAQGIQGDIGLTGAQGVTGLDGNTILGLPGAPDAGLGRIGDLYLDTAAIDIYGPKDADGWGAPTTLIGADGVDGAAGADGVDGAIGADGVDGAAGADGSDGRTWLTGEGVPDPGAGVDGDLYLDTTADAYYGPKAGGIWGDPTGLVGPQGEQGIQGTQGVQGDTGTQGIQGPEGPEGPAGTTATELVFGNFGHTPAPGEATSTATCPVGDVPVSGGYDFFPMDQFMAHYITVVTNRPDGANGWTVTATDYNGMGFDLVAFAVCASNPA